MKTALIKCLLATVLVSTCILNTAAFGQGTLTPPGVPAPTMKTLAQIEPRTPIASAPFTISTSGSYYLTTNVTVSSGDAITIAANNVTLDLNGFTITSTRAMATTDSAILLSGGTMNVYIYNGNISSGVTNTTAGVFDGGGFGYGIYYSGTPYNVRVKDVSVAGVLYYGINIATGNSTVVGGCTVNGAGSFGIYADSVSDSTAMNCGSDGIVAGTAHNCIGSAVGTGDGLSATTANNCYGYSYGNGAGLDANTANNCYGQSYGNGYGLDVIIANNCYGQSYGNGIGLDVATANNCYGYSNGGGYGLYAVYAATGCFGYNSSSSGTGLYAYNAAFCTGYCYSGTAIHAAIANGCISYYGANIITYKYNMP